jgi:hypothetical protein
MGGSMDDSGASSTDPGEMHATDFSRTELAIREQNGVAVTLFWLRGTGVLVVAVVDDWNGESFELVLEPDDRPLDVFHHPYAYATARGIDIGASVCGAELELVDG